MRFIILLVAIKLFAYYAKIEPFKVYEIKSDISGKVLSVLDKEAEFFNGKIIQIDDRLNKIELKTYKEKLKITKDILEIEKKNYQRLFKIRTKSALEKDNQKIKILNIKNSIKDIEYKIEVLKDTINKKSVFVNGYIDTIYVKKGDFVSLGSKLVRVLDLSKSKATIYIPIDKIDILKKDLYIDGIKTDAKIKVYKTDDNIHLGTYKVEIILNNKNFSKLVKIEFK